MHRIGILSVQKEKKSRLKNFFCRVIIKEQFGRYVVAEITTDIAGFSKMGSIRRKRLAEKAKKLFAGYDVAEFVAEKNISEYIKADGVQNQKIPASRLFEAFEFAVWKTNAKIKNLIIIDKELKNVDYNNLKTVCGYAKEITILTDKKEYASALSDRLMFDYGACVNVLSDKNIKMNAVADTDRRIVRIGDFIIDGAEFESDSGIYDIDMSSVAAILKEDNDLEIKNWISGKNIIKKVDNRN